MKRKWKIVAGQVVSWLLCISMTAPNVMPIAAEAAVSLGNLPRYTDFSRPEALKYRDLRLASGSDVSEYFHDDLILDEDAWMEEPDEENEDPESTSGRFVHRASGSDAELREPEDFYDEGIEEPDGILVEFNGLYRTYQTGEKEFVSIIGGYSGLYMDDDGVVKEIDNRLVKADVETVEVTAGTATLSDAGTASDSDANEATPSDVRLARPAARKTAGVKNTEERITFSNGSGAMDIRLPQVLEDGKGIVMETDGHRIELTPQEGNFGNSVAYGNAIRYSSVYPGIDYQYTILGDSVKEDIILMEPSERNSFTYRLDAGGLRVSRIQNRVVLYEDSREDPVFCLNAPVMEDASGERSFDILVSLRKKSGDYYVTITADEAWLSDPAREYPVRIDPSLSKGPMEFKVVSVASGRPDANFSWTKPPYVGYDDGTMSGNTPGYENCRTYFSLGSEADVWNDVPKDQEIISATFTVGQQTDWSSGQSVFALEAPNEKWSIASSWNQQKDVSFTRLGTRTSPGKDGLFSFDITGIMKEWLAGTREQIGLCMRALDEPGVNGKDEAMAQPCEILYNQDSLSYGPRLEWTWNGELKQVGLMDVRDTTMLADPVVVPAKADGRVSLAVVPYGDTQAGAKVFITLMDSNTEAEAEGAETLIYPDFTCENTYPDAIEKFHNNNWQGRPFETGAPDQGNDVTDEEYSAMCELELNREYYFSVYAEGYELTEDPETGELELGDTRVTSEPKDTDKFLLYRIKKTDYLPRIATYYGVDYRQLLKDNHLRDDLTREGDVLFIRNPSQNQDRPYSFTPPTEEVKFLIDLLLRGRGLPCEYDHEPINMSTGNFYMEQTDADMTELGGEFSITRSYNSIGAYFRSEFGIGWNSPIGEHLMKLSDGRIVFIQGDGGGLCFTKDGDGYQAPEGYDLELRATESVYEKTKEEEEETGEDMEGGSEEEEADTTEETETDIAMGWELEAADGTLRTFNEYGLLTSRSDRKGNTTSCEYDDRFLLEAILTPSGKEFPVTMDEEGKILEIGLPDGGVITYEYDGEDNLVSVTNPEGDTRRYEYDEEHRMTAWYDENGSCIAANEYDEEARVILQTDAEGNQAELSYGSGCTVSKDNRGSITRYYYDDRMRSTKIEYPDGSAVHKSYTEDNRLESETDEEGQTTRYTYDENGNILSRTRGDGSTARFTYNDLNLPLTATDYEGHTSSFTYDEAGNLLSMTDGAGNTTHYDYDMMNRVVSITDANGGITRMEYDGAVVTACTDPEGETSTFTYDEMNRVLTESDPEGNTTEHVYNANGWETASIAADGGVTVYEFSPAGEVVSITDAMGVETTFTYDKMHNILSGMDALGNTLEYAYDENYNRISETNAKGDVTGYEYDARNRLVKTTDALGHETAYELDGTGNILSVTDRRGNTSETGYDKALKLPVLVRDELGYETRYEYDRNGNLTEIHYPDGASVSYAYDGANRLIRTAAQNGLVTEIGYDGSGNVIRIMDDETRVYRFRYDGCNRLVKATDPLGGVTEYAYDGAGNRIRVTDANGNSTDYGYDAVGRLKEVQDALGGVVSTEYDLMGRTLGTTDQNGHTTVWHYDVIGQVLAQADAAENITAMEYDSLGNVIKVIDALKGETTMDVDALSRTVRMTDALGGEYAYEYDENGNLLTIAMPDGDTVHMSYDASNRMTYYRDEASVVTHYEYDSMGRITKAADTAGNVMAYAYDACGNLVKQTDTIGRDAVYEYDQFNRLVSVTGTDLATTTYGYDALDRLTSVTQADGAVTVYEYDPAGNLVKTTEPGEAVYAYAYDAINRLTNKVNPVGASTSFQYDAKGNLTGTVDGEGNTNAYVYDVIDRLTAFTDGRGNETIYEYDELSRLLSQTTPESNKTEYRYDALGRLIKEKDPNSLITEYQYDVMGNLIESISPKGAKTSYTYDKHDELTSETDPAGNVTQYAVDLNRRVTEMTRKNGAKYQYTYDPVHRLTSITTPLGLRTELTYDAADNVIRETDNLDRTNTYEYDIMHRMTKSVNAEGGITNYGYDIRGNRNQLNDALGYTWNYRYDLIDQLTASVDPEGKATEFTYNLVGEIASITKPGSRRTDFQYDGNYNVTAISDPKGYIYEYTYDKDNRLTGTKNPLGETETVVYDAGSRVTSVTDRMGLTESYTYDPHGNVLSVTATNGLVTRFAYDILDNLVKVTMPSNLTTSYTYDVMGNVTSMTDTMLRTTQYTYDAENNLTSITDAMGRKEQMTYDIGGRQTGYISSGGNQIHYDYDRLNDIVEKSYEDARDPEGREGVVYAYDVMGQRVSMMDRSGESKYEYDGLGRIIKVTSGSGEVTEYAYDECDQLESITYADGAKVSYKYDKNDNLTQVTDRTGAVTAYVYDAINRVTEIHRPNGVSTYNTYNARDQIVSMKNICDDCEWVISQYDYTYDDRGFIVAEDAVESLYGYAWDDKHDGKHENWHDDKYPHGDKHINKHDKDGVYNFQIIGTKRTFEYDEDGKLTKAVEDEDRQGQYIYLFEYDDMGNRTYYEKSRNGTVQERARCTYNAANQLVQAEIYNGKKTTTLNYGYDGDGNRITETGKIGTDKVELTYTYTVENRLKAVHDADELLAAMAYDGDGNRIFMLNYNLHTDDDWKGNSGNGNGNNKDNSGSGSSSGGTSTAAETGSEDAGLLASMVSFFTGDEEDDAAESVNAASETEETEDETEEETDNGVINGNKNHDKGNNGNAANNGVGNGNGNSGNNGNGNGNSGSDDSEDTGTVGTEDNNGNAAGNTTNTDGSTNQSSILFPIDGEVSELEQELIDLIKTTGKQKNYELVEYVNDVNREHTEVLMELNINGIMDTAYSYGNERLTNERFTGWTGYYTYDPRGSVGGVTDSEGMIWQSYRYDAYGNITFGKPQYNNVYSYNAESYNPNMDVQYLRARYYCPTTANFMTEDTYLGDITDPLTLNRYNYVKSSPLNYTDPSGHRSIMLTDNGLINTSSVNSRDKEILKWQDAPTWRLEGESFFEWKIRLAKMSGTYELCVRESTQYAIENYGGNPFDERGWWDNFWFSSDIGNAEIYERTNAYLQYLFGTEEIADTEETYQIRLTVYNILADTLLNDYSAEDATDKFIDDVYGYYLVERVGYANTASMILLTIGSIAAQKAVETFWKTRVVGETVKGGSNTPNEINYDSKQVGKKYGEHKLDYPDMKDYTDYKDLAEDIFNSPDQIIHDTVKGEYYYTKGNDLLRIKENSDFVSLYPGAESERVLNAIKNGGVMWP